MTMIQAAYTDEELANFRHLYRGSLIPLHACLVGLVWVLHDYLVTLEDEIRYIWPQRWNFGKVMFLWIRYYSIALLVFDVAQIHIFSIPGITNDTVCVAMDSIIRVVGAITLWSIEVVMQLRVYALYKCSKRVAIFNGLLFLASIVGFLWILIHNAQHRHEVIASAIHLPLPGCPSIHSGIEWAQWVPATVFEAVLFFFALFKSIHSATGAMWSRRQPGESQRKHKALGKLYEMLLRDNIIYFFAVTCLLIFNNLMVVGVTKIPWFSYSPFHAALSILTTRMLLNLRKATSSEDWLSESAPSSDQFSSMPTHGQSTAISAWDIHIPSTASLDYGDAPFTDPPARYNRSFPRRKMSGPAEDIPLSVLRR